MEEKKKRLNLKSEKEGISLDENNLTLEQEHPLESNKMFIQQLKIYNNIEGNNEIRRITEFHTGINFIVDEAAPGEKANNTGKTTALKLIDVCLGSKDRKYIYTDSKTGGTITEVYNQIKDYNITAQLTLVDSLDKRKVTQQYLLTVELKPNGKRYINGIDFVPKKYWAYLNKVIFKNDQQKPSFRQLIPKFVRIGVKGDKSDSFLKVLGGYGKNSDYRLIYEYLFGFSKNDTSMKTIEEKKKNLEEEKTFFKKLKKSYSSFSEIDQQIRFQRNYLKPKEKRLKSMISGNEFKEKTLELNKKRQIFSDIEKEISNIEYEISKIDNYLAMLEKNKQVVSENVLKELYDETSEYARLSQSFEDLLKFNEQLNNNQVSFQKKRRQIFLDKLASLENEKLNLDQQYGRDLGLVQDVDIDEYAVLSTEVTQAQIKLEELEKAKKEFKNYENSIEELNNEITTLQDNSTIDPEETNSMWEEFNIILMNNTEKICGESFSMTFTDEGFPLTLNAMKQGLGTGRTKSLVVAFDLSYLEYADKYNLSVPYFIVHDVLENIDEQSFKAITEKIYQLIENHIDVQYIASILSEKINPYDFITEDMIVEKVSETDKYLKI